MVIKPNCGGSGNHVRVFNSIDSLEDAIKNGNWDPNISIDGITLIQKMVEAPFLYRLEFVGNEFLYAVKIRTQGGSFNRCPCEQKLEEESSSACTLVPKFEIILDFPSNESEWMLIQALTRMLRANRVYIAGIEVIKDAKNRWWVIDCNCVNTNYNVTAEHKARVPLGGNARIAQWLNGAHFSAGEEGGEEKKKPAAEQGADAKTLPPTWTPPPMPPPDKVDAPGPG